MIRAKHIQLVIVTAVLSSCNRVIIPDRTKDANTPDSTLTLTPIYDDNRYACNCVFNPNVQPNPFDVNLGFYYTGQRYGNMYTPGRSYRKLATWQHNKLVLRGGFGKTTTSTAS